MMWEAEKANLFAIVYMATPLLECFSDRRTDEGHCRAPCFDRVGCDRAGSAGRQIVLLFQKLENFRSITKLPKRSASASNLAGTSRPSARAVLRLTTNANLVGCTTGRRPA